MYNFFRKMLICTVVASIYPSFAFSAETCPSGYISVVPDATLSDDAIIVTDADTCPSGYTSVGGDIKDVVNCISDTTVTAPVCTFYDETYSVTYDCNGGTGSATGYATYNSVFTPRTDVCARDGYSFNGYTINGNTVPESFTWTYPGPRTLVAQWAQKAVITFDINIAPEQEQWLVVDNYTESVTVLDGELSAQIITPQMENGYKFGGYWTEPDGGDMHYDIDGNHLVNNITEDITLYAHWVPHSGNLAFDANGGTGTAPQSPDVCNYDSCIVPENTFTAPENYEFAGWTYQDDGMGETFVDSGENIGRAFVSSFMNGRTLTLYPVWEKIVCADGLMLANGECVEPEVVITTTEMQPMDTFIFYIKSDGEFYVDWGDGNAERIITSLVQISHTYSEAGVYNIGLYGQATGYNFTRNTDNSIGFMNNNFVKKVTGSFGDIFGVLPDGTNPSFTFTFTSCTNLEEVSEDLFSGLTGGRERMFYQTFTFTPSLKEIPAGLFSSITTGAPGMFNIAFASSGLTSLPDGLFANVQGKPATEMFASTFAASENLTGYIPANMFASLSSEDFDVSTMSYIFGGTNLGTTCPDGTVQYITGFESAWDGKVACVPCPDGVCSITTPCSSEVGTGERTCYFDANTGDYTNCDETCTYTLCNGGYYMNGISCTPCPDGLTSAIGATSIDECGAVRTLHIGDNDTMQLFSIRPSSSPVMVFEIDGQYKYFGQMSDMPKTISSDSDKHFIIKYNDTEYYLHDYTVE